jgi:hypothetical protein
MQKAFEGWLQLDAALYIYIPLTVMCPTRNTAGMLPR